METHSGPQSTSHSHSYGIIEHLANNMCNNFCKFRTHSKDNTFHVVRIILVWFIIKDKSSNILNH
jgi:hypothetical protein